MIIHYKDFKKGLKQKHERAMERSYHTYLYNTTAEGKGNVSQVMKYLRLTRKLNEWLGTENRLKYDKADKELEIQ